MNYMVLDVFLDNLRVLPIVALAGFLGKVWAARIARREQAAVDGRLDEARHSFQKDLERLKGEQEGLHSLVAQAHTTISNDGSWFRRRTTKRIDQLWKVWLTIRRESAYVFMGHSYLTHEEIESRPLGYFGPNYLVKQEEIDRVLEVLPRIVAKLRAMSPLLKSQR